MGILFEKVVIIGFGLMGSSLAQVIRNEKLCKRLVGVDQNNEVLEDIIQLDLADEATDNLPVAVKDADLIVICSPVGTYKDIAIAISDHLKAGCIITDVGSVKNKVIEDVTPYLPADVHFVPGHPIAGSEKSGPRAGYPELFMERWVIITPTAETELKAIEKVTALWDAAGSMVEIMDPEHHDLVLGITSHLPHLIAYTIVGTAADQEAVRNRDIIKYSAGGFRDFTRLAAHEPTMWRDIFLQNKDAVLDILQLFTEDLTILQRAIRDEDGDRLHAFFDRTRGIRKRVIDAGQAKYHTAKKPLE